VSIRCIDISNEKDILQATFNQGVIDILINNAALNPKFEDVQGSNSSRFEEYPLEVYEKEISVGLTGAMLCSKHIGALMVKQGKGVILNIASDLSIIAPDQRIYEKPGVAPESQFKKPVSYSVIKSGLIGLTRYLATYWATSGVRVNALSPGGVFENQDPIFVENLTNLIPMNRMASIVDYKGAVQFLCSDASSYMTGQNIVIDGGRSVW
jgi:NAD(P)-dependent dehydrogenase (short-subunit alcohol dehydrogenase family)